MRESLKQSIEEYLAFSKGVPGQVETRIYPLNEAPDYTGEAIKKIRKQTGLDRQAFAMILAISPRTLERWEISGAKPSGGTRRLLQLIEKKPEIIIPMIQEVSKD